MPLPSVFQGVLDCRLPTFKCSKRLRRPPRQQLLQLYSYSYTCPCHLFFRGFKTAVCPPSNAPNAPAGLQGNNSYSYMPLPSQGNNSYSYTCSAICFSGGSRLPFARLQTLQTLPQASKATASKSTTLTATCPCHLSFRGFYRKGRYYFEIIYFDKNKLFIGSVHIFFGIPGAILQPREYFPVAFQIFMWNILNFVLFKGFSSHRCFWILYFKPFLPKIHSSMKHNW